MVQSEIKNYFTERCFCIFLAVTMLSILLFIFVLYCTFFIHKTKFLNTLPRFDVFLAEILLIVKSL